MVDSESISGGSVEACPVIETFHFHANKLYPTEIEISS